MPRLFRPLAIACMAFILSSAVATSARAIDDGFYISLGIGGAAVLGERGVELKPRGGCSDPNPNFFWSQRQGNYITCVSAAAIPSVDLTADDMRDEIVRTDAGSGLAVQIRLGYHILGYASVEMAIAGNGATSFKDGQAHVDLQVRYHPIEHVILHDDRDWDTNVFFGVGYSFAGYKPTPPSTVFGDVNDRYESKGWTGLNVAFGAAFDYAVSSVVSFGVDFRVMAPIFSVWTANWTEGYRANPVVTPSTWVVAPTAQVKFHM